MLDALHPVLARTLDVHHLAPNHHGPRVDGSWTLRRLFPGGRVGAGDFVVLNACRNQPRKRIDLTLDGFSRFARDKQDVELTTASGEGWSSPRSSTPRPGRRRWSRGTPRSRSSGATPRSSSTLSGPSPWAATSRPRWSLPRALDFLYRDRTLLDAMAQAAVRNATDAGRSWETIGRSWSALTEQVLIGGV